MLGTDQFDIFTRRGLQRSRTGTAWRTTLQRPCARFGFNACCSFLAAAFDTRAYTLWCERRQNTTWSFVLDEVVLKAQPCRPISTSLLHVPCWQRSHFFWLHQQHWRSTTITILVRLLLTRTTTRPSVTSAGKSRLVQRQASQANRRWIRQRHKVNLAALLPTITRCLTFATRRCQLGCGMNF